MRRRCRLNAWANHAAMNLGGAAASIWYALVPPWMTGHSEQEMYRLSQLLLRQAFWQGLTGREE